MSRDDKLITPVFRVAFPLLTPPATRTADNYGKVDDKYRVTAIWTPSEFTEKDKDQWRILFTELDSAAKARFKMSLKDLTSSGGYSAVPKNGKDKTQKGFGDGTWYASLSSKYEPRAIDVNKNPLMDLQGSIYAGCYCRASVFVYSYDVSGNKGVSIGLRNIQKVADGERFDTSDGSSDFDDDLDEKYKNLAASTAAHDKFGSNPDGGGAHRRESTGGPDAKRESKKLERYDDDDTEATLAHFEKLAAKGNDNEIPF